MALNETIKLENTLLGQLHEVDNKQMRIIK